MSHRRHPAHEGVLRARRPVWARYGVAVATVAAATLLMFALYSGLDIERGSVPFIFFFGAVILSASYGGRGPGFLSILLSAIVADFFFIAPFGSLSPNRISILQVCVFILVSLFIVLVTDRSSRAEAAAQESEESLSTTLRSIGDGVIATDMRGRITLMNAVAERLTGWSEGEARGRELAEVFRIVNEETRGEVESPVAKVLREGAVAELANHTILIAKDGAEIPIDDSGAPVRDREGRSVGVVLVFHDITERRRAEEGLRESEGRFRAIAETASEAIITIDESSTIYFVNTVAEKIFGHTSREMLGQSLTMLMPDYLRRVHKTGIERYVSTGRKHISWSNVELPGLHKDGREIPLEVSFSEFVKEGKRYFTGVARDITKRKQAAAALARLAAIIESSEDAILSKTLEGRITSWNAAAERIYGYTAEEAIGQHISFIAPPDRAHELEEILGRLKAGGRVEHLETVRLRKDGARLDVSITISPIRDAAGAVIGASTIARAITERKRAEEALRESEERFRQLADAMPQIVWTARADGYIDYYNRRWFEYTGMTQEQTEGWGWQPVLHPDDVENSLRTWSRAVVAGHTYEIEYRYRRAADGQYRWHLGRAEPIRDPAGNVVKWFGTSTDIHDQKQAGGRSQFLAEAGALLASSLDYEQTLERMARLCAPVLGDHCLIDVIESDGRVTRVAVAHADPDTEAFMQVVREYPPDVEMDAGVARVLRTGRAEVVTDVTEEVLRKMARGDEHLEILRRVGLKSFATVPLIAREHIVGALTFGSTGERREYDAEDLVFAREIATRAALAIDNARLYRKAQEVNRAKDEFLATLSHELRTPLTPILGWTHMMSSGRLSVEEAGHGLSIIENNAQALTRLINDLLDMSSILSGKMSIERAPVVLGEVVAEAVETVRPQAARKGINLEVSSDGARALVSGDRTRLVQVFWNLLANAVKFSPEGGRVEISCGAEDGHARVVVADEGKGIDRAFLPQVFERFRQADGSTTREHGGLGIGLSLVKSFTEAHEGEVKAESEGPGRGSRFTVTLPLLRPADSGSRHEEGVAAEQPATRHPQPARAKVLLVEDARDTLDMLRVALSALGYETVACDSAQEALRVAASMWFDIIVSDIGLPQTDGYELIRRLRKLPHLAATPAVALTGYASPKDAELALAAGFNLHVPKPVDPADLAAALEQLLERKPGGNS